MTRPVDDDFVGVALSEQWGADEPPLDFARNVTSVVQEERRSNSRSGGRGVVVPFLLAAIFVSFGAAASWDTWGKPKARAAEPVTGDPAQKAAARLTFHSHEENGLAERETRREQVPAAKVKRTKSVPSERPVQPPLEAKELPQRTEEESEQVHYPRCECGTNGVVCTCVD